ncbi:hypothetical protein ACQGSX_27690, partial [Bacillus sp. GMs2/1]|uniref:hypothetical protein n=1 Tax=Bacillus sp. GMs2/1 TaxID=3418493 RepID=UPI003CF1EC8E
MSQLMDLNTVSNTFQRPDKNFIVRDNLLEVIDNLLVQNDLVLLDGEDELGKTVLLQQYCERHYDDAISFFVKPSSRANYNPENIRMDLCNQINWIINNKELKAEELKSADIHTLTFNLQRYARVNGKTFYFVIDGLEDIPDVENYFLDLIITDFLPVGLPGFKVLISSNGTNILQNFLFNKLVNYRELFVPGFTREETHKYFEGLNLDDEQISEIRKLCKGKPGKLADLKRLLNTGISLDELFNDPEKMPDLCNYEWELVDEQNDILMNILCLLAFDNRKHTINSLSLYLKQSPEQLTLLINTVSVLDIVEDEVIFYSEPFRKFVANKLADRKNETLNFIIDTLLNNEFNDENLVYLPDFFIETNRYEDLLNLLTSDNYSRILSKTESISTIRKMTEMGMSASNLLDKNIDVLKFGIQNSIINEDIKTKIWNSEINALISLNEFEKALTLAQSNQLIEDRLHMLAIIARNKIEQGFTVEPEILDQISNLYKKLDIKNLGAKALEIAADLIYTNTELAIELVEKSAGVEKGENALDMALATVSISALNKTNTEDDTKTLETIQSKIKSPAVKSFFNDFYIFIKDHDSAKILSNVKKLESATDQINILSNWSLSTKSSDGGYDVIKYAFNIINNTPDYAPNAGIYNKLSNRLQFLKEDEIMESVNFFESQIDNIERSGPRLEYIKLQLNIIKALNKINPKKAYDKLEDLYLYVSEIEDLTLKGEGFASIYSILQMIDQDKKLEKSEGIHTLVEADLEECLDKIVKGSASQYDQLELIIGAISKPSPQKTIELIERLNTQNNRESAYHQFIVSVIENGIETAHIP